MKPIPRIVSVVALAVIVSGCFGGTGRNASVSESPSEPGPAMDLDWAERALPSGEGHDHYSAEQHRNLSTPNFEVLGWNPLISDHYGYTPGGHLCGDSADTGQRRYSVVPGMGTDVAFILVDVTNASNPQKIGELAMPTVGTRDIALTPDLRFVVLGTTSPRQPDKPVGLPFAPDVATWRSPCNEGPVPVPFLGAGPEQNAPLANGVVLVNIQNPKQPVIESYFPLPALGAHSMYATQIRDQHFVLASVVNLVAAVSNFYLFEILSTPAGAKLSLLSIISEQPHQGNAPLINGHNDGVIQIHPVTGRTLAYLAHWHQGLVVVDITNPRLPTIIGRWSDNPGPHADLASNDHGDIHEALPIDTTWNGRHYTFVGQEILGHPTKRPSGYMKALDTTDPTRIQEVAMWSLPVDVQWGASLQFSTHYISRVNRTVFMSHYHGGVWAIDVSDLENTTNLPAIGVFLPANVSPKPRPIGSTRPGYSWAPTVMENNALFNGDLVVWDMMSGCYVVHFDATRPAPPLVWEEPQ